MENRIYVPGFRTFAKNEKAPEFILGNLVVSIDEFNDWVKGEGSQYLTEYNGKTQLRLTVLTAKDGRVNFQVDTYKQNGNTVPATPEGVAKPPSKPIPPLNPPQIDVDDSLPF